jgi:hypothetical protein
MTQSRKSHARQNPWFPSCHGENEGTPVHSSPLRRLVREENKPSMKPRMTVGGIMFMLLEASPCSDTTKLLSGEGQEVLVDGGRCHEAQL